MKFFTYTILFLLVFSNPLKAQRHKRFTYFGIELGTASSIFKVEDAGKELYSKQNFQNPCRGIFLEQELDYIWSISTGIYFSKQKIDFRFRRDGGGYNDAFEPIRLIEIPLLVRANIPLTYGTPEVRLTPLLGTRFVFNQSKDREDVRGRIAPDLSDNYSGSIRRDMKNAYLLAEGGLNLDMMFAQGLIMSFGASYSKGFFKTMQADLSYSIAKSIYRGTVSSTGDNINIHLSLKYPVSRFWRKSFKPKKAK
jgi:hypothetical protein